VPAGSGGTGAGSLSAAVPASRCCRSLSTLAFRCAATALRLCKAVRSESAACRKPQAVRCAHVLALRLSVSASRRASAAAAVSRSACARWRSSAACAQGLSALIYPARRTRAQGVCAAALPAGAVLAAVARAPFCLQSFRKFPRCLKMAARRWGAERAAGTSAQKCALSTAQKGKGTGDAVATGNAQMRANVRA
jgi:hypothetical protein